MLRPDREIPRQEPELRLPVEMCLLLPGMLVPAPAPLTPDSDWICLFCQRGQCRRCRDRQCACCNGTPETP
jgi:hypothetical protein